MPIFIPTCIILIPMRVLGKLLFHFPPIPVLCDVLIELYASNSIDLENTSRVAK